MKDFTNSTKMQTGHNFPRTSVAVPSHQRAMPMKKSKMPSVPTIPPKSGC